MLARKTHFTACVRTEKGSAHMFANARTGLSEKLESSMNFTYNHFVLVVARSTVNPNNRLSFLQIRDVFTSSRIYCESEKAITVLVDCLMCTLLELLFLVSQCCGTAQLQLTDCFEIPFITTRVYQEFSETIAQAFLGTKFAPNNGCQGRRNQSEQITIFACVLQAQRGGGMRVRIPLARRVLFLSSNSSSSSSWKKRCYS